MGQRGSMEGVCVQGAPGGQEGVEGIAWGHRVGLMSLFMIHKANMPVYQ